MLENVTVAVITTVTTAVTIGVVTIAVTSSEAFLVMVFATVVVTMLTVQLEDALCSLPAGEST